MTEQLLQFIWKHRYYNQQELQLTTGETIVIEDPGILNSDQGPDFINARIRFNGNCWIGSVELHIFSSGWEKHHHGHDDNYRNVILHVVWKQDQESISRNIPQLELMHRVPRIMLDTYESWMQKPVFIPCEKSASKINPEIWDRWASSLLTSRLERKMSSIIESLSKNQYHWEEQLWWMIAGSFGNPVNNRSFETIARTVPYPVLIKNRNEPVRLEAMLAGQANLLNVDFNDAFPQGLKKEYEYIRNKYQLKKVFEPVYFLRMRPENFPSIRISQLAALCTDFSRIFAWILRCETVSAMRKKLHVCANEYWKNHYVFDKQSPPVEKHLGSGMRDNIIINSIVPILYAYGKLTPDPVILQKAVRWLKELPAEHNHQIVKWKKIGIDFKGAAGSQSLMELKKQFCDQRRCLECDIAKNILQSF